MTLSYFASSVGKSLKIVTNFQNSLMGMKNSSYFPPTLFQSMLVSINEISSSVKCFSRVSFGVSKFEKSWSLLSLMILYTIAVLSIELTQRVKTWFLSFCKSETKNGPFTCINLRILAQRNIYWFFVLIFFYFL